MRNGNKSTKMLYTANGEGSGKMIWNPYLGPDYHKKLLSSSDWWRVNYFCSNPAHRQNDRQTDLGLEDGHGSCRLKT